MHLQGTQCVCRRSPSCPATLGGGEMDMFDGSCNPSGGPEQLFKLELTSRSLVNIRRTGESQGAVFIRTSCAGGAAEAACGRSEYGFAMLPGGGACL